MRLVVEVNNVMQEVFFPFDHTPKRQERELNQRKVRRITSAFLNISLHFSMIHMLLYRIEFKFEITGYHAKEALQAYLCSGMKSGVEKRCLVDQIIIGYQ